MRAKGPLRGADRLRALTGVSVRSVRQGHSRRLGYSDDDEDDHAVVYLGKPIHSGCVLIPSAHLANVTSLEHER